MKIIISYSDWLQGDNIPHIFREYFENTWIKINPPSLWSQYSMNNEINISHTNNKIERYWATLKANLPSSPPTIDLAVNILYKFVSLQEKEIVIYNSRRSEGVKKPIDDITYRIIKKSE